MAQVTAGELDILTKAGFTAEVIAIKSQAFIQQTLDEIRWGGRFTAVVIEGKTFGPGEETFGGAFQAEVKERATAAGAIIANTLKNLQQGLGLPSIEKTAVVALVVLGLGLWIVIKVKT